MMYLAKYQQVSSGMRMQSIILPKIHLDEGCIRRKSQRGLQWNNWYCIRPEEGRGDTTWEGGRGCSGRGQPWREGGAEGEQSLTITSAIRTTKVGEHTSILRGEELNKIIFDILLPPFQQYLMKDSIFLHHKKFGLFCKTFDDICPRPG